MSKGEKYGSLTDYLNGITSEKIMLSFDAVADIVGGLPASAYIYPAWWSNGGHTYSNSWMCAGFKTSLDITNQKVTFIRAYIDSRKSTDDPVRTRANALPQRHGTLSSLDIRMAISHIRKYHETTAEGEHTRYRSWVHCYKAFHDNRSNPDKVDYLCLHLFVYLASWGMLRNSFLLNQDYLVHKPIVNALISGKYEQLYTHAHTTETIPLVMQASDAIQMAYPNNKATDTLITKILLGVFGCAPAYDRYFKDSARKYKVCNGEWGITSLQALWDYYQTNYDLLEALRSDIALDGLIYPPMKLMDMCLWQIGFDEDNEDDNVQEQS